VSGPHQEHHRLHRSGWLRAAVLGANDGIVSTASLIVGVAAAEAARGSILLAGTAGLVAGAVSMAAGEYVSVKSQEDTERADLEMEKRALADNRDEEEKELAAIYQARGLDATLAAAVARQLMEHDALGAHARDEIGITDELGAKPMQAAFWSAASFSCRRRRASAHRDARADAIGDLAVPVLAIGLLGALGAVAAATGGAPVLRGAARVCFWGNAGNGPDRTRRQVIRDRCVIRVAIIVEGASNASTPDSQRPGGRSGRIARRRFASTSWPVASRDDCLRGSANHRRRRTAADRKRCIRRQRQPDRSGRQGRVNEGAAGRRSRVVEW
jgi:VIT1/CCC1 family predicted Fe2+/Mn2+ transporter